MKRYVHVLAALLLVVGLYHGANAAWNIIQKDDGTVEWRNTKADTAGEDISHPVGSVYLNVLIADLTTLITYGVISPITRAKITSIRSVIQQNIETANAVFAFYVATSGNDGTTTGITEVTNGLQFLLTAATGGRLTISQSGSDETGTTDTFLPSGSNEVERGSVILIQSLGAARMVNDSITSGAMLTITLERY